MMVRKLRRRRTSTGQALVEFSLLLPIIMFLIIGAIDMGRAVVAYNTLANAARHGSRVAAVNQLVPADSVLACNEDMPIEDLDEPHWSARACTAFYAWGLEVDPADVTLSYAPPGDDTIACGSNLNVGCIATISVAAVWQPITPGIGSLVGPINLSATSAQPIERVFP
jgi:hypothetical protein